LTRSRRADRDGEAIIDEPARHTINGSGDDE